MGYLCYPRSWFWLSIDTCVRYLFSFHHSQSCLHYIIEHGHLVSVRMDILDSNEWTLVSESVEAFTVLMTGREESQDIYGMIRFELLCVSLWTINEYRVHVLLLELHRVSLGRPTDCEKQGNCNIIKFPDEESERFESRERGILE